MLPVASHTAMAGLAVLSYSSFACKRSICPAAFSGQDLSMHAQSKDGSKGGGEGRQELLEHSCTFVDFPL